MLLLAALVGVLATGSSSSSAGASVPSSAATETLATVQQKFPDQAGSTGSADTLQLVLTTKDATSITTPAAAAKVAHVLADARSVAHVATVTDPLDAKTSFVSADKTTAVATLTFTGLTEDDRQTVYDDVVKVADQARADFQVEVGGQLVAEGAPGAGIGEIAGVLVAFVVLFLTFGSLLVAGANMLVALTGVGIGTLGILAYGSINPIQGTTLTLATMLGLAVGIDYSLFILTRFRAELREGRSVEAAIGRATGTAGTAVVFAGLTVIIALVALIVVRISFITEMGIAGAFGVLVAVLMSLTLLPVLMRSLGRRILPRRERDQTTAETPTAAAHTTHAPTTTSTPVTTGPHAHDDVSRAPDTGPGSFLQRWVNVIIARPVLAIVAAVIVLLIVAAPLLSMKTASNVPGGTDPTSTQRAAYTQVLDKFGGVQSPLLILLTGKDAGRTVDQVSNGFRGLGDVQSVVPGKVTATGDAALITVIPRGGPIDDSTKDLVHLIRDNIDTIPGVQLRVTGETAIGIDGDAALNAALIKYVIVIVVLAFLLLVLMFRSILVPLTATLGYLLSVGASFGASVAVFQWGWLDRLIPAPQGDPMLSILPIILVGVLFGLAMDYQMFLVSRIHEMHGKGFSPKEAIRRGFTTSAPVLVAAASIMAVVFGGFATSESAVAASIAFGLVVGVIADAFLVRTVIMPALLVLMGNAAWWFPAWLERILPNLDVEGHALDADTTATKSQLATTPPTPA
ncbi:MMPL family transporter [Kribbella alba]|uniref:MMPL family transporter n=1 Tax=Kribbella alba TaxID=190197 RepID=UPI0031DC460F